MLLSPLRIYVVERKEGDEWRPLRVLLRQEGGWKTDQRVTEYVAVPVEEHGTVEDERDAYRALLADLVAATKLCEPAQSLMFYRYKAIEALRDGPLKLRCAGNVTESGGGV